MAELWPYRPTIGTAESLEWFTEILRSRTGEQRLCLREVPRQFFDYSSILEDHEFSRAKAFARRNANLPIKVPVWVEVTELDYSLAAVDTTIDLDTTTADYRVDGDLIVWSDNSRAIAATILAITPTQITLTEPLGTSFSAPVVAPVRLGLAMDGFSYTRESTFTNVGASFLIIDNENLTWVTDYPQYLSLDVITEETVVVSDINETIIRISEYVDSGFGLMVPEDKSDYNDFGQTLGFVEYGAAALWRRRKWFYGLRGKQQAFWLPSFNEDLRLAENITSGSTLIKVDTIGPLTSYVGQHIMIELNSGVRYFREIVSAAQLFNDIDQIVVNSAISANITQTDIRNFSFLSKVRLNSDTVQFEYLETGITTITVQIMEIPA